MCRKSNEEFKRVQWAWDGLQVKKYNLMCIYSKLANSKFNFYLLGKKMDFIFPFFPRNLREKKI